MTHMPMCRCLCNEILSLGTWRLVHKAAHCKTPHRHTATLLLWRASSCVYCCPAPAFSRRFLLLAPLTAENSALSLYQRLHWPCVEVY